MLSSILLDVTLPNKPVFFCEGSRIPSSEHKLDGLVKEFGLRVDQLFPFGTLSKWPPCWSGSTGGWPSSDGRRRNDGPASSGGPRCPAGARAPDLVRHLVLGGQIEKRLEARLPIGQIFASSSRPSKQQNLLSYPKFKRKLVDLT